MWKISIIQKLVVFQPPPDLKRYQKNAVKKRIQKKKLILHNDLCSKQWQSFPFLLSFGPHSRFPPGLRTFGEEFPLWGWLPGSNFPTSARYSRSACASSWQFATCGWKSPVTMGGTSWHGWNQRGQHSLEKASFCIASNLRVSNLRVLRTFKQQKQRTIKRYLLCKHESNEFNLFLSYMLVFFWEKFTKSSSDFVWISTFGASSALWGRNWTSESGTVLDKGQPMGQLKKNWGWGILGTWDALMRGWTLRSIHFAFGRCLCSSMEHLFSQHEIFLNRSEDVLKKYASWKGEGFQWRSSSKTEFFAPGDPWFKVSVRSRNFWAFHGGDQPMSQPRFPLPPF